MNVLLIVDPQIDFISGSLAVEGAAQAMDKLAVWMKANHHLYQSIVITMDQHPADHCSFEREGGIWPPHCVRYSVGAAIYPVITSVVSDLMAQGYPVEYVEKATRREVEEYSAFANHVPASFTLAEKIYVAGIAGDYCVKQSVEDLALHGLGKKLELLEDFIPYIHPKA
ncbi:isochorismatase family protein [Porphyromonas pogonae]|uniref:isochorismatase family protein n=1 Tax=Porphyromonas pogonae TaxID=867595 RepID=UPI002E7A3919|nr:isochorismatase family protein [Porphyromonas pogonae]